MRESGSKGRRDREEGRREERGRGCVDGGRVERGKEVYRMGSQEGEDREGKRESAKRD